MTDTTIDPGTRNYYLLASGLIGDREYTEGLEAEVRKFLVDNFGLTDDSWGKIKRYLELKHGITSSPGQILQIETFEPWLPDAKGQLAWDYWNAYKQYLRSIELNPSAIQALDRDTDGILGGCGNPQSKLQWLTKGLVMGDVQSGKTSNYTGLIAKAADAGYKVIVLLTGVIEELRRQSQERLDFGFVGVNSGDHDKGERQRRIGAGCFNPNHKPAFYTTVDNDFSKSNKKAVGGISINNHVEPALFVMKKNKASLENFISLLTSEFGASPKSIELPVLVVDDEADNASVNTKRDDDPALINKLIRRVLERFQKAAYVAYTATPFANVFINPEIQGDLFPSEFVFSMESPTNYLGAKEFFGDDAKLDDCLRDIDDIEDSIPEAHGRDHKVVCLPQSLREAIDTFLLSSTIRDLRGERLRHRSMLVNVSRFTLVQEGLAKAIGNYLYEIVEEVSQYMQASRWHSHEPLQALKRTFDEEFPQCEFGWDDVRHRLRASISGIQVLTVNQNSAKRLDYSSYSNTEYGRRVIAVGGLSLSRGLTLEGLSTSYFARNSKAYDTLLQMGRWFGYRAGYEDLVRIWMPEQAQGWFSFLARVAAELRSDFKRMQENRQSPSDFGMKVLCDPDGMIIATAANKMRDSRTVELKVSFSGKLVETPYLPRGVEENNHNLKVVTRYVSELGPPVGTKPSLLWKEVPSASVASFLSQLQIRPENLQFLDDEDLSAGKPIIKFIGENDVPMLRSWEVCIAQGEGTEIRLDSVSTSESSFLTIRPRMRQFQKPKRPDQGFLVLNKQRLGEPADSGIGLDQVSKDDALQQTRVKTAGATSSSGELLRKNRKVPLLLIQFVEPKKPAAGSKNEMKRWQPTESDPHLFVGISIVFPVFGDEVKKVVYRLNKVKLREIGLIEEESENDED